MKSIGFIGAGNMATALIKGIIESKLYSGSDMMVSDIQKQKQEEISKRYALVEARSNQQLASECRIIMLCIKPQSMKEVLNEIKGYVRHGTLVITIAAGISINYIENILGEGIPLIRVMPNTPALIQMGMSAIARGRNATDEHMRSAEQIFKAVGDTVVVEEDLMDAVTALSGSGPGYFFRFMECLVEAGLKMGVEREISLRLVVSTALGSAILAKRSGKSLEELRKMVTSPGGTTESALNVFYERGFENIIVDAISSAFRRAGELGRNY
jgi:pyrroline-5-carboxylate reductase